MPREAPRFPAHHNISLPQVPRALVTDDLIWFIGSAWGSLFGWAQLLSLYLARTAAGCVQTQDCAVAWLESSSQINLTIGILLLPASGVNAHFLLSVCCQYCREMYISSATFCGLTGMVFSYIGWVLSGDAHHKRLASPFGPLRQILLGGSR